MSNDPAELYLDLLKRSLLGYTYTDVMAVLEHVSHAQELPTRGQAFQPYLRLPNKVEALDRYYEDGLRPRRWAHSMVGRARLDNVHRCLDAIRADGVPGDLLEAGVWKGGVPMFMTGYLKAHAMQDRTVWLADSFQGVPPPTQEQDEGHDISSAKIPWIAVSEAEVREHFRRYGLLDGPRVEFLKGWFKDTLPSAPIGRLALLRADGDLYESTVDTLSTLYDRVSPGGFVIIDDYGALEPCRRATDEFRAARGITEELQVIDWTGVFWRKAG